MSSEKHRLKCFWSTKTGFSFIIAGISLTALTVRLFALPDRDLCYWDEGIFLMGVRFFRWRCSQIMTMLFHGTPIILSIDYPGFPVFLQKPIHVVLLSITSFIFGINKATGTYHAAIYGSACVAMTGFLAHRLAGSTAGIVAAVWLCFEPYHVHYSRIGLHETDSMLLLLSGVYIWFLSDKPKAHFASFSAGVLLILAMGSSYRLVINLLIIAVFEVTRAMIPNSVSSRTPMRLAWMACGAAMTFLSIELLHFFTFYPEFTWSEPASYFQLLRNKFISSESTMDLDFPFFYLNMFNRFDGPIPGIITIASLITAGVYGSRDLRKITCLMVLPLLIFSVTTTRLARTPTSILPWIAILAGTFLSKWIVAGNVSPGRFRTVFRLSGMVAGFLVLMSFCVRLPPIYSITSGYCEVYNYLKQQGTVRHVSTMLPIAAFYVGKENVVSPASSEDSLKHQIYQQGFRYLVVDWQQYVRHLPSVMKIQETYLPVFVAHNPVVSFFATLHENYLPNDVEYLLKHDSTIASIKVYDLWAIFGAPESCDDSSQTL